SALSLFDSAVEISGMDPGIHVWVLERKGVISIDRDKARAMRPEFGDRITGHTAIGTWIAENKTLAEMMFGGCGLVCAAINWHVFSKNRSPHPGNRHNPSMIN